VEGFPGHRMHAPGERVTPHMRNAFKGTLIANGGYDAARGNTALANGEADAISFGITYLANPDLLTRLREGYPLNAVDQEHLYTPGPVGYTDYPTYQQAAA
jgi:N-ethylmaleimide reductase